MIIIRSALIVLILFLNSIYGISQTVQKSYKTTNGEITFFSKTPMEDIEAKSTKINSIINPSNKNFACTILINSFEFDNSLMKEHFNEKYLESDKYPKATFAGIINEDINLLSPGIYNVSVTGKLAIHGTIEPRTINGIITIDDKMNLILKAEFDIKLVDHKIEVPRLVFAKIAEVIHVKINTRYNLN